MTDRQSLPWKPIAIVFGVSLVYFLSYMRYGFAYDEGYLLDSVEKILDGQVIYRDFHHTYAPGGFYLVAGLFKIFGQNILVERVLFAVLEALKCALAFAIVRTITPSRFAYLAPVLAAIAPGPWHKVFLPAFGFLALYAVLVGVARKPVWYFVAGLVIGASAVFRQDVAAFAAISAILAVACETARTGRAAAQPVRRLVYLACGAALVVGPVLAAFVRAGALGAMIHDLTVEGMLDNMTNRIPYPGIAAKAAPTAQYALYVFPVKALFYLPFAAYALTAAVLVKALLRRAWAIEHTMLLAIFVAALLAFNQSMWRSDVGHLLQTMQYVFLLVPVLLGAGHGSIARRARFVPARAGLTAAILFVAAVAALFWATAACTRAATDSAIAAEFQTEGVSVGDTEYVGSILVRAGNDTRLDVPRAPILVTPAEARFFGEIGRFLDANTRPGDYVLAVPQLQTMYFLFDRRNPTRYSHYRRRLSPEEEKRYIRDIEEHQTEYILLTEPYEGARIGQTAESFSQYGKAVRDWILANYAPVGRIGWVTVLKKRS